jgi:c-di-GMP-binding flagellar brake protein YcgR
MRTQNNGRFAHFRAHPRARVLGQVLIHDEERLYLAPLTDISVGGVFVSKLVNLAPGSIVKVVVKGPRLSQVIQAEGKIVRVEQSTRVGLAVQFTEISALAKEAIQSCVFEVRMEAALKAA